MTFMKESQPYILAEHNLPEITLRVVILAIVLSFVLAISNAYLALKIGLLTSASIPAAIISMGILRFFKNATILENNLVQTAASAGEAVAGGIVYTIPALIIIHYWMGFNYWQNFLIAIVGGVLGVMFSIPLRRILMEDRKLRFPEGRAIAEILKISNLQLLGVKDIFLGGLMGAILEFFQTGVKLLADNWQAWFKVKNTVFGFGLGFSPAMIGAGYLIGIELAASIFVGALLSWLIAIPVLSHIYPELINASGTATDLAHQLWGNKIRYIGIGAMLVAGLMTLGTLVKPFIASVLFSFQAFYDLRKNNQILRTDKDIPIKYVLLISLFFIVILFFLYQYLFPVNQLGLNLAWSHSIVYAALLYTVIAGFIFCAITAYFSGMVGVSASPGSAVIIASLLIVAALLFISLRYQHGVLVFSPEQIKACEAITIICTAVITGMAAISNDNMQDLKVGYLLGATPWKQQIMLLLGVLCASLVITPVMQMLFDVYGIAGVMPRPGMNPTLSLPAPPAAAMAMLSQAVFEQHVPWNMLLLGGLIVIIVSVFNRYLSKRNLSLSVLGVAIGMYLPLATSMPLFVGGLICWLTKKNKQTSYRDITLACGLIAGAALLDVALAIPFSIMHNPDAMNIAPAFWLPIGEALSFMTLIGLFVWFKKIARFA
jgi:putative OPT family oligopeptide transporter